jgi:anti-sigma factor RsiW
MVRFLEWPFIYFSEAIVEDRVSGGSCLEEREIENLVRGKLNAEAKRRCQAHLLWCASCQNKVEEEAEFARAIRSAAEELKQEEAEAGKRGKSRAGTLRRTMGLLREWFGQPFYKRWAVVAVSAGVLIAIVGLFPLRRGTEGEDVVLRSERGSVIPASVESAASAHARLRIDVSDVAPYPAYQVAVVDADGRTVEARTESATAGKVVAALHAKLMPGRYWIRLSAPDGRLLREYALRVRP